MRRLGHTCQPFGRGNVAICRILAAIVLTILFPAGRSAAQDEAQADLPGLTIEAVAGWDGTVDESRPVPVSFLISNATGQIVEGTLTLSDPHNNREVTIGEVAIGPNSTKSMRTIQNLKGWFECFATLRHEDEILWQRELSLASGSTFSTGSSFVLYVDAGGRSLQLGELLPTSVAMTENPQVGEFDGRPVHDMTIPSWQVPNHAGVLLMVQVIVLSERLDPDELNRNQWRSLCEWLCQGGTLFVHADADELIQRLLRDSPLAAGPGQQHDGLAVRRVGLGNLYEFPLPLFSAEATEQRRQIADISSKLSHYHIAAQSGRLEPRWIRDRRADRNRLLFAGFFVMYAISTGLLVFLHRMHRRRLLMTSGCIVLGASVLSAGLGVALQSSDGDLRWASVTQAGEGGLVQVAKISVQSAGGRNSELSVRGSRSDLQYLGRPDRERYYYYYQHAPVQPPMQPYTWQPNLSKNDQDQIRVHVPMTPWGTRQLHATAFQPGEHGVDLRIRFRPSGEMTTSANGVRGQIHGVTGDFDLSLTNHFPFTIYKGVVVIGATYRLTGITGRDNQPLPDSYIDVYQTHDIQALGSGALVQTQFPSRLQEQRHDWDHTHRFDEGRANLPRLSRLGEATAWLFVEMDESPILSIDESGGGFVANRGCHLLVQQIRPEDMPDPSVFYVKDQAAK